MKALLALVATSLMLSNCASDGRCIFAPKKQACATSSSCCATKTADCKTCKK